jgi:RES domain-containing protein
VTAQQLLRITKCYRIGDPAGAYPIFDPTGSKIAPGRWNTPASPMIYTSEHYSTAMLEKLVHGSGMLPPNQHYIGILLQPGLSYEELDTAALPAWADPAPSFASKTYGEAWYQQQRSLLLFVPSVVARLEFNILINPSHPEFPSVQAPPRHHPVWWDTRLFPAAPATSAPAPPTPIPSRPGRVPAGRRRRP